MPQRATALTSAAGEHFVAYKLSSFGYPVALTQPASGSDIHYSLFAITSFFFVQAVLEQENFANRIVAGVIRLFIGTERSP